MLRLPDRPLHSDGWLPTLEVCVETGRIGDAVALLRRLVPSYQPSPALAEAAGVAPEPSPPPASPDRSEISLFCAGLPAGPRRRRAAFHWRKQYRLAPDANR